MIKIGIIGCGKITQLRHGPEYNNNPTCTVVGYFDHDPTRAQELVNKYGGKVYHTLKELLEDDLDAVSVCVANAAHGEVSIKALQSGKHVLCEKPMAITLAECEEMNRAAKDSGKLLMIGQNQRFAAAHIQARALIKAGEIGTPLTFKTHFGHGGPENWTGEKDSWFFDKKVAAFGAMADLGVHKTDLIHYLLGEPIVEVTANLTTLDKKHPDGTLVGVDDNAFCIYKTQSGAMGTMNVSWTNYGQENNSTVIYGTKGVIRCYDHPDYALILEKADGSLVEIETEKMASNEEQKAGGAVNTGVIDHFLESIALGQEPRISGEEGVKAMRVIFVAQESSEQGKTLKVEGNGGEK